MKGGCNETGNKGNPAGKAGAHGPHSAAGHSAQACRTGLRTGQRLCPAGAGGRPGCGCPRPEPAQAKDMADVPLAGKSDLTATRPYTQDETILENTQDGTQEVTQEETKEEEGEKENANN